MPRNLSRSALKDDAGAAPPPSCATEPLDVLAELEPYPDSEGALQRLREPARRDPPRRSHRASLTIDAETQHSATDRPLVEPTSSGSYS
jgi:hypothetical protein